MSSLPVPVTTENCTSVAPVGRAQLPSRFGAFQITGYKSRISGDEYVAVWTGDLRPDVDTLVRIHSQCLTGEVFGSLRCDCASQLDAAMEWIAREGRGVIVYQFEEGRGIGILNKIRAYALQDNGADTVEANEKLGFPADIRTFRQCAEVLLDLNLRRVRVISGNPEKLAALREAGLEIVGRVSPTLDLSPLAAHYLDTKKQKLGHLPDTLPCGCPGENAGQTVRETIGGTINDLIRKRRSAASFSERAVPVALLRTLLDSARWSASSFNEQPWRFLMALRGEHVEAYEKMYACLAARNQARAKNAPVLMITTAKRYLDHDGTVNRFAFHDVGQAMANLALHATAFDLQVHQMGGFDVEAARAAFSIPEDHTPVTISAIGYPTVSAEFQARQRKPLDSVVSWGEWSR